MIITDANVTKSKNIAIFLDGEFSFSVPLIIWEKEHLKIGMELSPSEASRILYDGNMEKAKTKAFRLLDQRSYTKKKLTEKLREKFDLETASKTAEKMEELGLIDDRAYAENYAAYLLNDKGCGKRKIIATLKEKGIDDFTIEDVICSLDFSNDFQRAREKALKRKAGNDKKEWNRIYNYLLRQGYSYDTIKQVLQDIFDEEVE